MIPLFLFACDRTYDTGPFGIPLAHDGVTYAGASVAVITPDITESFTDLDGDAEFDGCLDQPQGGTEACPEPFTDTDGDGWFDAVFIGGFSPMRPATGVHDDVTVRALVLARDGEYLAIVTMDLVGVGSPRIRDARERLAIEGFDRERLFASSSHNHQGPDTMGLWGNPYDFTAPVTGLDPAYQERVTQAIFDTVREASRVMEPVELSIGKVSMRDRSVWFNGPVFGGKNPTATMHGMVNDIRDPVIVSDQLLVLQATGSHGEAVFTLTNWSGHPETRGGNNNQISADWVGVTRTVLEAEYGGIALHAPECLGGMQSALGGDVPLVADDGTHVMSGTFDADGDEVPVWAEHESWGFVTSHGWHVAEAAIAALDARAALEAAPIRTDTEVVWVPIENIAYQILGPQGMFDLDLEDANQDPTVCPEVSAGAPGGCIETRTSRIRIGDLELVAVPGELLPEIAWGFPDDAAWAAEVGDPTQRGSTSTYFPQHDADCNGLDWATQCQDYLAAGSCDCLKTHVWPYAISYDASVPPLLDLLDAEHRAVVGMADDYLSYIVPEPDFHHEVSLLSDDDGDHYEDTVSPAHNFATRVQEAQIAIDARW